MTQQDDITQRLLTTEQRNEFIRRTSFISESDRDTRTAFVDEIARAALASAPVADEESPPTAPDDDAIAECWISASDIDGIAYDGPSFERGYRAALASVPVTDLRPHLEWALRRIRTSLDTGDKYEAAQAALDAAKVVPVASAPVADEKPDESNSPVPLIGHSMGPLTPIYDYVGSLIGQALATARHGAYEGSIVWTRMRHAGEWMPWHVAGKQSVPVAGEAQPLGYVMKGREWPNQCYYPSSHKPTDIHNWTPVFDHAAPQASAVAGEAQGWSGWACQYPDKLPRLYGAKEIAQLNCDAANGDRVLFLSEHAAPQASEAVRIQFPAHLRKMWSGGEVQAWLDEHQGVTPPKVSAKGSLERYRKWQAEREEAFGAGVKAAADLVKKMVDDYDTDHGSTDPETGTREYPGDGAAWVCDMEELEGSIRALSAQPAQKEQSDEN